ncbi:chloride channel protein [Marasmitruncus massiliensis]|uniref:chloride channel protein n=1 Tax=Marasmitruncus massiliensis TaxID=1944642 RepID=UPI001FA882F7|nr:chloride channel protein [Marasmitruncus massiliensis]
MCILIKTEQPYQTICCICENLRVFLKWLFVALITGGLIGGVGSLFHIALNYATELRITHGWMIWLLPLAGVLIVFLYRLCNIREPRGTDLVIEAVRTSEELPAIMAPLIFVSTILTHLCGGSAGREGAVLQIGGSIGNKLGKCMRLDDEKSKNIMIMCGMSAAFSALFGTPVTATVFSMELISVGVMYYAALVPCAVSAVIALEVARACGVAPEAFQVYGIPDTNIGSISRVLVLSLLCAGLSIVFCFCLHQAGRLYKKYLSNQYLRAAAGGALVLLLVLVFQTREYLGAGMDVIERSIQGEALPWAFALKLLFTAVTLGAGYKGGEIVPGFFVGATFGCVVGGFLGLHPSFGAALGLVALFCGVTNCPITALMLAFELFHFTGVLFFLLAVAVSYMLSGYFSLYSAQKFVYAKTRPEFINRCAH